MVSFRWCWTSMNWLISNFDCHWHVLNQMRWCWRWCWLPQNSELRSDHWLVIIRSSLATCCTQISELYILAVLQQTLTTKQICIRVQRARAKKPCGQIEPCECLYLICYIVLPMLHVGQFLFVLMYNNYLVTCIIYWRNRGENKDIVSTWGDKVLTCIKAQRIGDGRHIPLGIKARMEGFVYQALFCSIDVIYDRFRSLSCFNFWISNILTSIF